MATFTITGVTADHIASLGAFRTCQQMCVPGTSTPIYATVADMISGEVSKVLSRAIEFSPGTGTAAETAIAGAEAAMVTKNNALRPTLTTVVT